MTDDDVRRDLERRMAEEVKRAVAEFRRDLRHRAELSVASLLKQLDYRFMGATLH